MIRALTALVALSAMSAATAPSHLTSAKAADFRPAFDLAKTPAADWRPLDPANTLYLDIPTGRVVIELAPDFAPNHVANIKALVRSGYFDDSAIVRAQDNYVVQWSAPETRKIKTGQDTLKAA